MIILNFALSAVKILFLIWANIYALSYAVFEFKRNKFSHLGVICLVLVGNILLLV